MVEIICCTILKIINTDHLKFYETEGSRVGKVVWVVTPCGLTDFSPEDGGSILLRNVVINVQVHTALQSGSTPSTFMVV